VNTYRIWGINHGDVRCGLHLIIWDLEDYLRSPELSSFTLSRNIENKAE